MNQNTITDHPLVRAILETWPGSVISTRREALMVDPTEHEEAALGNASDMAGQYIESLRKTDLADFTSEEWRAFVQVVVTGFQDKLIELKQPEKAPF